jgi:CRP/FNR family cyclic AMP-dependent transcriptional regulator
LKSGAIGKVYYIGDIIVSEGEPGDCMYAIQEGTVEVIQMVDNRSIHLAYLKDGDFFGEIGMFVDGVRSATVRAMGKVRILTIDKKNFQRRIHEDPSFAYNIIKNLSERISRMYIGHLQLKASDRRNWDNRPKSFNRPKKEKEVKKEKED